MQYFKSAFFNESSTVEFRKFQHLWDFGNAETTEIQDYRVVRKIAKH